MKVLVACEFSGTVRRAFSAVGHDAWSCDLLPSADNSPFHIQGDVRDHFNGWDMGIFHPPCTFLANSGVRWLYGGKGKVRDPVRWRKMEEGAAFFNECKVVPSDIALNGVVLFAVKDTLREFVTA